MVNIKIRKYSCQKIHSELVSRSLFDQESKKILCHRHILSAISTVKRLLEQTMKTKIDVRWKGYDNLFNSWINMKDLVQR